MSTGAIWQRFCRPFMIALRFEKTAKGRTNLLDAITSEYEENGRDGGRSARSGGDCQRIPAAQEHETDAARGRRFAEFDVERLNKDWIIAVRSWLADKHRTKERMMDDLAAEL